MTTRELEHERLKFRIEMTYCPWCPAKVPEAFLEGNGTDWRISHRGVQYDGSGEREVEHVFERQLKAGREQMSESALSHIISDAARGTSPTPSVVRELVATIRALRAELEAKG